MRHEYYKLVIDTEKLQPIAVPSDTYDRCEELRVVGRSWVGALRVSTVFLSLNHAYAPDHPPMIFETFVFPAFDWGEIWGERCSTYEEALALHKKGMVWAAFAWRHQLRSALTLVNVYAKALWRTAVVAVVTVRKRG